MAGPGTLTAALEELGAFVPRKILGPWSSCKMDGSVVTDIVGFFWLDQFFTVPEYGNRRFYFGESLDDWLKDDAIRKDTDGFKKWRSHLNWAWQHNRKILIVEVTPGERIDGSDRRRPNKFAAKVGFVMKLMALDQQTGAYVSREEEV